MRMWTGMNVFQWEHKREWQMADGASQFVRAEGALLVPGFSSLSVFFRRESQSVAGAFTLHLWTAPIYFQPLDTDFSANPKAYLYELAVSPQTISTTGSGTGAQVFGGQISAAQPMGSMLFWEIRNSTGQTASIIGDIYVVPNHTGSMVLTRIGRTVDGPDSGQPSLLKDR